MVVHGHSIRQVDPDGIGRCRVSREDGIAGSLQKERKSMSLEIEIGTGEEGGELGVCRLDQVLSGLGVGRGKGRRGQVVGIKVDIGVDVCIGTSFAEKPDIGLLFGLRSMS